MHNTMSEALMFLASLRRRQHCWCKRSSLIQLGLRGTAVALQPGVKIWFGLMDPGRTSQYWMRMVLWMMHNTYSIVYPHPHTHKKCDTRPERTSQKGTSLNDAHNALV